jgi:phenylalanyl-tRNA synthetase beta chain
MKFSYKWIKEYIETDLAPKEAAELLVFHSFETEIIKETAEDTIFDIDILPNRFSDAASHFGVARELKLLLSAIQKKNLTIKEPEQAKLEGDEKVEITIENTEGCSRYTGALIRDVEVGESPSWLKDHLSVCGVGSINNIVDITNFVMLEMGQPIHAFDFGKLGGQKIVVRNANQGEKIDLLDGRKIELDEKDLVIADEKDPLALAGIKGGKKAELGKNTKNIFIESAYFDSKNVYLTSKKHRIETDASRRFSANLDSSLSIKALARAVYLIKEVAKGKLAGFGDANFTKNTSHKIKLNVNRLNQLIGVKIDLSEIKNTLSLLGCEIKDVEEGDLLITIPSWRKDLQVQEDLVEEIARIYSYEKISSTLPYLPLSAIDPKLEEIHQNKIKEALKGTGFYEAYTYSFLDKNIAQVMGFKEDTQVELKNPISERFSILRPSILPGLLLALGENLKHEPEMKFFELGKSFCKKENEVCEKSEIGIVLALKENALFELKGTIEFLLESIGINDYLIEAVEEVREKDKKLFNVSTLAIIKIGDKNIGRFGKISSKVLREVGIEKEVVGAIIDGEKLFDLAKREYKYEPISKYPSVLRDLAILVDSNVRFSQVMAIIENAGGKFIKNIDLFDVYEGKNLPKNKKSLALHLTYQSNDHTLRDKEVNKEHKKVEEALKEKLNAVIR